MILRPLARRLRGPNFLDVEVNIGKEEKKKKKKIAQCVGSFARKSPCKGIVLAAMVGKSDEVVLSMRACVGLRVYVGDR